MVTDKKKHLEESLETHKMKHIQKKVDAFASKAEEVRQKLCNHYGACAYNIFRSGSFTARTSRQSVFRRSLRQPRMPKGAV